MIDGWPHLEPLRERIGPVMNCEVGLLLGYDCPRALATKSIIPAPGTGNDPFGMETVLGWGIVGVIGHAPGLRTERVGHCHGTLVSPEIRPQTASRDGTKVNKSESDHRPLPSNRRRTKLPNDYNIVINQMRIMEYFGYFLLLSLVISLIGDFGRNPVHMGEHKVCVKDTLVRDSAVRTQLAGVGGDKEVQYIPHSGVYHKAKKKTKAGKLLPIKGRRKSLKAHTYRDEQEPGGTPLRPIHKLVLLLPSEL